MYHFGPGSLEPDSRKQLKLLIRISILTIMSMTSFRLECILISPSAGSLAYIIIGILIELKRDIQGTDTGLHGFLVDKGIHQIISLD